MIDRSRREFLGGLGALAVVGAGRLEAELVLYNANVLTIDPSQPRARAVAIAGGRFLAVGAESDVLNLATARTRRVDLGGRTVVPGFIDAHSHPAMAGLAHLRMVDCDLRSIPAILEALRARARETPPGEWVLGFKYDDTKTAEGRPLSRADLDAALPDHPAFVEHRGGHTAYVNTPAFAAAGVARPAPDPAGGRIFRDASGAPDGKLAEAAVEPFSRAQPQSYSRDDRRAGVKRITEMMTRAGVTSVHDAYGSPDDLRAYQDAREADELKMRIYCLIGHTHLEAMQQAGIRTGFGDAWVRVGAMKLTCDGSISERTARLSQPYVGRPDDFGILVMEPEALYERCRAAHAAGWQIGVHANGDVAIDLTLSVYERLQREAPRRDPRFRLEHCTVVNDDLVHRIAALGAIPNPFSTYVYYHGEKMREYGAERLERMFAVRSFLDAGVRVTQTSDYPPGPFEPMMALQSSVTRTDMKGNVWGPSQRITVAEALRVGTLHGAYASFEEREKGSIEAGKLADLVVLGRDPLASEPSQLIEIPIHATMVGGKWMFEA
jgi:predicted amidohydrolase YtcJ